MILFKRNSRMSDIEQIDDKWSEFYSFHLISLSTAATNRCSFMFPRNFNFIIIHKVDTQVAIIGDDELTKLRVLLLAGIKKKKKIRKFFCLNFICGMERKMSKISENGEILGNIYGECEFFFHLKLNFVKKCEAWSEENILSLKFF